MGVAQSHDTSYRESYSDSESPELEKSPREKDRKSNRLSLPSPSQNLGVPVNKSILKLISPRGSRKLERNCSFVDLPSISLDDIELHENIGWGATGVIKRGIWNKKEVAVKLLFPHAQPKDFKQELSHWRAICHPNIVEVYGACTKPGQLGIVMEYVKCGNLSSYLRSVNMKDPNVWPLLYRIAVDIAKAMLHIHTTSERIHRDLKSLNVLLCSLDPRSLDPVAKVCDFGDCRMVAKQMTPKVGTISYMAPEVLSCEEYSNKVDVYSYGMLLWEIVTRKEPFSENEFMYEIAEKIQTGHRPQLPSYCPELVASLIKDCWDENPAKRPSFRDILKRLGVIGELWGKVDMEKLFEESDSESEIGSVSRARSDMALASPKIRLKAMPVRTKRVKSERITSSIHKFEDEEDDDDEDDDCYDEIEDTDVDLITNDLSIEGLLKTVQIDSSHSDSELKPESDRVRRLRAISGGHVDLHNMLSRDSSTINSQLLIEVLKASLKGETKKFKTVRKQNQFLETRLKSEISSRKTLEIKIKDLKKELRRSRNATGLKDLVAGAMNEDEIQEFEKKHFQVKWCEINFNDIQPEDSPYKYSSYGIWYKAYWNFCPARLIVGIGGVQPDLIDKFRQCSADIQKLTNHPNLCNLVGIVSKAPNFGLLYTISPKSIDLAELVEKEKLTVKQKLNILLQVSKGILHCHSMKKPIARFCPENIMVDSKTLQSQLLHVCNLYSVVQRNDTSWDKHRWHAPEIWLRNSVTTSSDIYTFGLIILFMITERIPYETFNQNVANRIAGGWRPAIPPACPDEISELIKACWTMRSQERIKIDDIVDTLEVLTSYDFPDFLSTRSGNVDSNDKRCVLFASSSYSGD